MAGLGMGGLQGNTFSVRPAMPEHDRIAGPRSSINRPLLFNFRQTEQFDQAYLPLTTTFYSAAYYHHSRYCRIYDNRTDEFTGCDLHDHCFYYHRRV